VQSGHQDEPKYNPRTLEDEIEALRDGNEVVSILVVKWNNICLFSRCLIFGA